MNKVRRIPAWAWVGGWLTLLCAYGAFFSWPVHVQMRDLTHEKDRTRRFLDDSVDAPLALARTEAQLSETIDYVTLWKRKAPDGADLSEVFGQISQLSQSREIATLEFSPAEPVDCQSIVKIPVHLRCRGPFAAISGWIADLERLEALLWVEQLKLVAPGKSGGEMEMEVSLAVFARNSEDSD
jgi:Tfp pilus assembly protein PilO